MNKESIKKFGDIPQVHLSRSIIRRPTTLKTDFNAGKLIPLYWDEIIPGETISMDLSQIVRMSTPITPVMDDCFEDITAYFVPYRHLWDNFEHFLGSTDDVQDYYYNKTAYSMPKILLGKAVSTGVDVLDYLGIPSEVNFSSANNYINAMPLRAYIKIWNDFWRDQNTEYPILLNTGDSSVTFSGNPTGDFHSDILKGMGLLPVSKVHDLFTSAFISPQRGPDTRIPVSGADGIAIDVNGLPGYSGSFKISNNSSIPVGMVENDMNNSIYNDGSHPIPAFSSFHFSDANMGTINQLRMAFQIQRYYERLSMTGNRYCEILRGIFGVNCGDARLQRTEYLGGKRINLSMNQVVQSSATTSTSPQGNTSGISVTRDASHLFTKSFVEHGILMICGCVRTKHTYSQGIERAFTKFNKFDYYFPQFANIGYQPLTKSMIYYNASGSTNNQVFGYQEAWYEYRYKPNRVSAHFRPYVSENLGAWSYADDFKSVPVLNADFMHEVTSNIDRTLTLASDVTSQFIGDYFFNAKVTLPMPLYSIPGLADHN